MKRHLGILGKATFTRRLRHPGTLRADCGRLCDMPDTPIAGSDGHDYPADMEARVRVLEEIAASTKALLGEIRAEQRSGFADMRAEHSSSFTDIRAEHSSGFTDMRTELRSGFTDLRTEQRAMRADIAAVDQRRERDFRITFGAIITTALGLAFLIARTAHWL
jgi:hypothetical protein